MHLLPLVSVLYWQRFLVQCRATSPRIQIRTSPDRTPIWTLIGAVWLNGASWTDQYTGTINGSSTAHSIFVVISFWGKYIAYSGLSSTTPRRRSVAKTLFIDGSNWWLSLGSFWTRIKLEAYGHFFFRWQSHITYNIRVGRATNAAGPYVDASGVNLLNGG
ncbi:hypothetical protein DFH07DRAFT_774957 [Mycena maculata]|uniref:Uncharacterized protein n=1 Tax=Mycena maculata TaxID=230809 RepID=A0AAD7N884_9AGAR|nr:hypothetical protein DFH07DRAFT_774957 [Mycena maculata]